ncbi:MAG: hypothetical protein MJY62_05305 [Bacteroidales bacterium]|nr:hypothetical protein [Bacteroidales bacterium]
MMKKILTIVAIAALGIVLAACGQRRGGNKTTATVAVKSQAEIQQEELIKMHLDTLCQDFANLNSIGVVGAMRDGKIVLSDQEKQIKPDYLADPSFVSKLQTLSQKYRAIAILAADKEVAALYDMPVTKYERALQKLYADVNDPSLKNLIDNDNDYINALKEYYASCKENGRTNLFWDAAVATVIEELYIASQNVEKFLVIFDDESASNVSYHLSLLSIAIEELAQINPEYQPLNESLQPLVVINAISLVQLENQLIEAKDEIAVVHDQLMN